jgi:hypothetical protein
MHPNNSTAFHACIQKNIAAEPLFHSFHAFHGQARTYVMREINKRHTFNYLAHVKNNRVHRGISGIKGLEACFKKTSGGMPWNSQESQPMSKNLRAEMPTVAAWIDELREAFGVDQINQSIKAGINGQPTFYASENGHEIGTASRHAPERTVSLSDIDTKPFNATAAHSASRARGN